MRREVRPPSPQLGGKEQTPTSLSRPYLRIWGVVEQEDKESLWFFLGQGWFPFPSPPVPSACSSIPAMA